MKKLIKWLAKVFKVDITVTNTVTVIKEVEVPVTKIVTKEVIKEVPKEIIKEVEKIVYVSKEDPNYITSKKEIDGDVIIDGNFTIKGILSVTGNVISYKEK